MKRRLERRRAGVVAVLDVRATDPVRVRVVDEFPPDLPVRSVEFDDCTAPGRTRADPDRVVASAAVGETPARFIYGLELPTTVDAVEISPPCIDAIGDPDTDEPTRSPPGSGSDGSSDPPGEARATGTDGTVSCVDARLDRLAARADRLATETETGRPVDVTDRLGTLEGNLEAVADDVQSVRADRRTTDELLADLERLRLSSGSAAAVDADRSATRTDTSASDRPTTD